MELMNGSSALALLFNSKAQNRDLARKVIEEVKEGNISALKLHCYVKSIEDMVKQFLDSKGEFKDEYMKLVIDEASKYPSKQAFELYGCKMQVKEAGTKYNYSNCNDTILEGLYDELESLEKKIKDREEFLKTIPCEGVACVVTGNILNAPIKTSTTTVSVTLPK